MRHDIANLLNISIAHMKSWGAMGHPCLTPECIGMLGPSELLMNNFVEVLVCKMLMREMKWGGRPRWERLSIRKGRFKVSYAFLRSRRKRYPDLEVRLQKSKVSRTLKRVSCMERPFTKPDWSW